MAVEELSAVQAAAGSLPDPGIYVEKTDEVGMPHTLTVP